MRRGKGPERDDRENEQDRESDLEPPVAAAEEAADQEHQRREQEIEPFLDRETPGDGVIVRGVGRADEVLDIEEIAQRVRRQEFAGHQRDDREGGDIGRDRAHPSPRKKHAEITPGLGDHPVDDLRREHKPAEDEEDLDADDRHRLRGRLEGRVGRQIMRDRHREGRRPSQKIERGASLHRGA